MINNDLYFTFIKISSNYRNLIVCKYWYKNIIKDIKKKKIDFYDIQLYNAINNKHLFLLYKPFDNIILNAYNNIILNIIKIVINDEDIKDKIMDRIIENYKQLSIIIEIYHNYNTYSNLESHIADEYSKILCKYYDYNIILA